MDRKKTANKKEIKEDIINIGVNKVKLTNQNKIYFPDDQISKNEVMLYYQSISQYILPHLKNRPQSLNRFPEGINESNFFQKNAPDDIPVWVITENIVSKSNDQTVDYIICNDESTLAYLNNLGCIDFNVWNSRVQHLENPDYLVLDLDPAQDNTFDDVIDVTLVVKEILDAASLLGYVKTSGSTGIHIYVPMGAKYSFERVKDFALLLMHIVQQRLPELTTLERSLNKREKGKIYLDYLQNRFGQTLASPYSLRPQKGASVSMPLEWSEIKKGMRPTDYNIYNALSRIKEKGDIFRPVLAKGANIIKASKRLSI